MRIRVILVVAILAVAAPTFGANLLTNGTFEDGLNGWTVVSSLVPWGGSDQTPAQVVNAATMPAIYEGVDTGSGGAGGGRIFQDTGNTVTPLPALNKGNSLAWTRTGLKGIPQTGGDTNEIWSFISQKVYVGPGTYYVLASYDGFAYGIPNSEYYGMGICLMVFGDDPAWYIDFMGNDNLAAEPPRTRMTHWNGASGSDWTLKQWTMSSNKMITTTNGWVEYRIVIKDSGGTNPITDPATAKYALVDNCYLNLVVPEPSSMLALMTGVAGLGAMALRRRR